MGVVLRPWLQHSAKEQPGCYPDLPIARQPRAIGHAPLSTNPRLGRLPRADWGPTGRSRTRSADTVPRGGSFMNGSGREVRLPRRAFPFGGSAVIAAGATSCHTVASRWASYRRRRTNRPTSRGATTTALVQPDRGRRRGAVLNRWQGTHAQAALHRRRPAPPISENGSAPPAHPGADRHAIPPTGHPLFGIAQTRARSSRAARQHPRSFVSLEGADPFCSPRRKNPGGAGAAPDHQRLGPTPICEFALSPRFGPGQTFLRVLRGPCNFPPVAQPVSDVCAPTLPGVTRRHRKSPGTARRWSRGSIVGPPVDGVPGLFDGRATVHGRTSQAQRNNPIARNRWASLTGPRSASKSSLFTSRVFLMVVRKRPGIVPRRFSRWS